MSTPMRWNDSEDSHSRKSRNKQKFGGKGNRKPDPEVLERIRSRRREYDDDMFDDLADEFESEVSEYISEIDELEDDWDDAD